MARTIVDELRERMQKMLAFSPPAGDQACTYCRQVVPERDVRWPSGRQPYCAAHEAHDDWRLKAMCDDCWESVPPRDLRWRGDRALCQTCHPGDLPAGDQTCDHCRTIVPEHAVRWRLFQRDLRPYCRDCVIRRCCQCQRLTGCPCEIWECTVCRRPVCFFDRDHSVRVDRTTCCLECVRSMVDVRGRVVALLDHLPAGIVRAIAGVEERSVGRYERALERTASQWPRCTGCRQRVPSIPRVSLECRCGRVTKAERPRCDRCREWACRACRGRAAAVPRACRGRAAAAAGRG
jgi:hypothetical protein